MNVTDLKIRKANKIALLFGATGLVGRECLLYLDHDSNYSKIKVFNRKKQGYDSDKIEEIIVNYDKLADYEKSMKGDDVYICLGTTMAKAGSKKAFIKVDYTYVMRAALACLRMGANQVLVVSAAGSDKSSYLFYNKVKGELESDLAKLKYWAVHIFKPSLLLGDRQEKRTLEDIASKFAGGIDKLFGPKLASYRPVQAYHVGKAMTIIARGLIPGVHYYNSNDIVELGQQKK